jgi:hypothetical protein
MSHCAPSETGFCWFVEQICIKWTCHRCLPLSLGFLQTGVGCAPVLPLWRYFTDVGPPIGPIELLCCRWPGCLWEAIWLFPIEEAIFVFAGCAWFWAGCAFGLD